MDLANATSTDVKKVSKLLEKKESLEKQVEEINRRLSSVAPGQSVSGGSGRSTKSSRGPAKKGRVGRPPSKGAAKRASSKSTRKRASTKRAASKRAIGKRATSKKATTKRATTKKTTAKKTTSKRATSKKAATKRASKRAPRGQLKETIINELQAAGKNGVSVKDLADRLKMPTNNLYAWFQGTGKKVKNIKKIAPGTYQWKG